MLKSLANILALSNTYQIFCNIHLERYIITFLINQINHVFLGILRLTIAHIFKDWGDYHTWLVGSLVRGD